MLAAGTGVEFLSVWPAELVSSISNGSGSKQRVLLRGTRMGKTSNRRGNLHSHSSPVEDACLEEESRRVLRVPVQIWGMSPSGDVFFQQAHTVEVGVVGASIEGLTHELVSGEVIGLEYGNHRARFKVIRVGQKNTPEAGKVELRPLDRVQDFWGLRTGVAAQQGTSGERRSTARYTCKGSISIRQSVTRFPLGAAMTDISLSGCYVELMPTLPVWTKVEMVIQVAGLTVNCDATVRTSHPGVGMGLKFEKLSETDRGALETAIARLR